MVDTEVWLPMKARHSHLLMALVSFADMIGEAWPGIRTLAERAQMRRAVADRALKEMETLGYFTCLRRPGRSNLYRLAARFVSRQRDATCPVSGTEERSLEESTLLNQNPSSEEQTLKNEASRRYAPSAVSDGMMTAKRRNLIKTARRWVQHSSRVAVEERIPTLEMLQRTGDALDEPDGWRGGRSGADKRWFDRLVMRMRQAPLDTEKLRFVRQAERGDGFDAEYQRIISRPWGGHPRVLGECILGVKSCQGQSIGGSPLNRSGHQ